MNQTVKLGVGVFQNRGVCGQAFPLLPSPSPFNLFFCFRFNFRAITRLETLATQAIIIIIIIIMITITIIFMTLMKNKNKNDNDNDKEKKDFS